MNCGIETTSGWNPPLITISDIVTVDLDDAIAKGGPFTSCSDHVPAFKKYGEQLGGKFRSFNVGIQHMELTVNFLFSVPPILLASIALQKSGCNPASVGSNGEQGLMQITSDKCSDAPSGNCQDVVRAVRSLIFDEVA
jgi:hypothetical protein